MSTTPLYSLWNTTQYILTGPTYAGSAQVTTQVVKSAFELPFGAQLKAGVPQALTGRSWSGAGTIKHVDVSTDGGTTWTPATLHGANIPRAWARWTFAWTPPAAGSYTLRARATDNAGNVQPAISPFNDGGYLFGRSSSIPWPPSSGSSAAADRRDHVDARAGRDRRVELRPLPVDVDVDVRADLARRRAAAGRGARASAPRAVDRIPSRSARRPRRGAAGPAKSGVSVGGRWTSAIGYASSTETSTDQIGGR